MGLGRTGHKLAELLSYCHPFSPAVQTNMPQEQLKALLQQLRTTLEDVGEVDQDTRDEVEALERELQRLTDDDDDDWDLEALKRKAQRLEGRFAAEYPVAERFFREIIDVLAKVGI